MKTDILIVGQGIAGTCLSYQMEKNNINHLVMDSGNKQTSSKVAAGIINPVVFKRLTKSWMADTLMPYLEKFYKEMEIDLQLSFFEQREMLKPLSSSAEINQWMEKQQAGLENYLGEIISAENLDLPMKEKTQLGKISTAVVHLKPFLQTYRNFLERKGKLISCEFDFSKVEYSDNEINIKSENAEVTAKKIVFCEGYKAVCNPYFNWLPFNLCKGEVLTIQHPEYHGNVLLNNGKFFLPLKENTLKVGSTYTWNKLLEDPSEQGKKEIAHHVEKTLSGNFRIIAHEAGIRPTVKDRRPFLGEHPKYRNIYIFNGMGTKGAMIAPYFSEQMNEFIHGRGSLLREVDIARYNE